MLLPYSEASKSTRPPSIEPKALQRPPSPSSFRTILFNAHCFTATTASLLFPKQVKDIPISKPCTCYPFCLEYSFPRYSWLVSFTLFRFLLKIPLFREALPDQSNNPKWYPPHPFSCFNFVHSIYYLPPVHLNTLLLCFWSRISP